VLCTGCRIAAEAKDFLSIDPADERTWNTASSQLRFRWLLSDFDDDDAAIWAAKQWGVIPRNVQVRISCMCIPTSARAKDAVTVPQALEYNGFRRNGGDPEITCWKKGALYCETDKANPELWYWFGSGDKELKRGSGTASLYAAMGTTAKDHRRAADRALPQGSPMYINV
jgi:hypothetical protein